MTTEHKLASGYTELDNLRCQFSMRFPF
jgi:hypothetical protein